MMTALLIAKKTFMESLGIKEADLMFDKDNPTIEEEILQEGITEVLLKPKTAHLTHVVQKNDSDEDKDQPDSPKFGSVSLEETKEKTEVS